MAVTQQIIRVPDSILIECGTSEDNLENLISFNLSPPEDVLDLDWSPKGIELYFTISNQALEVKESISNFFCKGKLVNEKHPNSANSYVVYSDIKMFYHEELKNIYFALCKIDWLSLNSCMPSDKYEAFRLLDGVDLDCHPNEYYIPKIVQLIEYMSEAVESKKGVAFWWD